MSYDEERRREIFNKTSGKCHHCGIHLSFDNHSRSGRGGWEVDHSNPKSDGGTYNLRNMQPLCWKCNSDKKNQKGPSYDKQFGARSDGGKVVEFFGGRAGEWGTDPHRDKK